MGWSCNADAAYTNDVVNAACIFMTGSSNSFNLDGRKSPPRPPGDDFNSEAFIEISRREHNDGAITGSIMKILPNGRCRRSGSFRIEGDGTLTKAPAIFKKAVTKPTTEAETKAYIAAFGEEAFKRLMRVKPPMFLVM